MNIISYINDPYSIEQTLKHLIGLFTNNKAALKQHINRKQRLKLRFGEMDINGKFLELKLPKAYKQKYSGKKKLSSELLFFDVLSQQKQYDTSINTLIKAITSYNRKHPTLWSDPETFFGVNMLIPRALNDAKEIPALIHYLSSIQLDKETSLTEDLNLIFEQHGWNNFTLDLLAARATILEGSQGQEQVKSLARHDTSLTNALADEGNQNTLLEKLTEYALFAYAERSGIKEPEQVISAAIAPFKGISEQLHHKSKFLKQSFIEYFPNYLPFQHPNFIGQNHR